MKQLWLKTVVPIATLYSCRMLGLFMLIPIFSVYALQLSSATPKLVGIALGSYGLTQALLQIPFGILSDRIGRKTVLSLGFILFALGSFLGAVTSSIYGMMLARAVQGAGAVGSVLIALLADLTPVEERTKAMAFIGVAIGLSFTVSMLISPLVADYMGLSGIFYITCILASLCFMALHTIIPSPPKRDSINQPASRWSMFRHVLLDKQLQTLNLGVFSQHLILTATFFCVPILLQRYIHEEHVSQPWMFYLPLMIFSFVVMLSILIISERKRRSQQVFVISIFGTALSQFALHLSEANWFAFCFFMFTYFVVFNYLEASLPSQVSKQSGELHRGTAMGIYSTSQFMGIFAGGGLAGFLYSVAQSKGIFITNSIIALLWGIITVLQSRSSRHIC